MSVNSVTIQVPPEKNLFTSPDGRRQTLEKLEKGFLQVSAGYWGCRVVYCYPYGRANPFEVIPSKEPYAGYLKLTLVPRNVADVVKDIAQAIFNAVLMVISLNQLPEDCYYTRVFSKVSLDELTVLVVQKLIVSKELSGEIRGEEIKLSGLKYRLSCFQPINFRNLDASLSKIEKELQSCRDKLEGLLSQSEGNLNLEVSKKKLRIQELKDRIESCEKEREDQKGSLLALKRELEGLKREYSAASELEKLLSAELEALNGKNRSIQENLDKIPLLQKISEKQEELNRVQTEAEVLRSELQSLQETSLKKQTDIESSSEKIADLRKSISSLSDSIEKISQQQEEKKE